MNEVEALEALEQADIVRWANAGCPHPPEAISEEFAGPDRRDGSGPTYYFCGECGTTLGLTGRRDSVL